MISNLSGGLSRFCSLGRAQPLLAALLIGGGQLTLAGTASSAGLQQFYGSVIPQFTEGIVRVLSFVESVTEITSVTVSVPPLNLSLTQIYPNGPEWSAQVPLSQLRHGANQAEFVVTDVLGVTVTNVIAYRIDLPPRVTITAPKREAIYSELWFDVDVSAVNPEDPSPVLIQVWGPASGEQPLVGTNRVQGRLPLSSVVLNSCVIQVTDPGGNAWTYARRLFHAPTSKLKAIASGDGPLLDFSNDRLLFGGQADVQPEGGGVRVQHRAVITDATGGAESSIELPIIFGNGVPNYMIGRLTREGAFMTGYRFGFDYHNGVLNSFPVEWDAVVSADSSFAAWRAMGGYQVLYSPQSGDFVTFTEGDYVFDISSNADLLLGRQVGKDIKLYLNRAASKDQPWSGRQTTDLLIKADGAPGQTPQFDGSDVAYLGEASKLHLKTGEVDLVVGTLASVKLENHGSRRFSLQRGWLAYNSALDGGKVQVWSRSPQGESQLRSFSDTPGKLETLLPNGWLTFLDSQANPSGRYLSIPGKPPIWISYEGGRVVWRDGKAYFLLHNSLFSFQEDGLRIDVDPPGGVRVSLHGAQGSHYLIQTSPDLIRWTDWKQGVLSDIDVVFTEAAGPITPPQFYRAVLAP